MYLHDYNVLQDKEGVNLLSQNARVNATEGRHNEHPILSHDVLYVEVEDSFVDNRCLHLIRRFKSG